MVLAKVNNAHVCYFQVDRPDKRRCPWPRKMPKLEMALSNAWKDVGGGTEKEEEVFGCLIQLSRTEME